MTQQNWFNLNISGLGYVNRIREVKPKKGPAFLCCDIAALRGPSDDVEYLRFDCLVTGKEAQQLIRRCIQACKEERKVLIQFRLGDLYIDTFVYTQGKHQGQTGVSLKAHLLFIGMIKVGGEVVYQAKPREPADSEESPQQPEQVKQSAAGSQTTTGESAAGDDQPPAGTKENSAQTGITHSEGSEADTSAAKAAGADNQPAKKDDEVAWF